MGRFLSGKIREAFEAIYLPGESYIKLKTKLLSWVEDSMEDLSRRNKKRFECMKWKSGELLRLFAARLERSFSLAYPSKRPESSSTLQRKFLKSVPRNRISQCDKRRSMQYQAHNPREPSFSQQHSARSSERPSFQSGQRNSSRGEQNHPRVSFSDDVRRPGNFNAPLGRGTPQWS